MLDRGGVLVVQMLGLGHCYLELGVNFTAIYIDLVPQYCFLVVLIHTRVWLGKAKGESKDARGEATPTSNQLPRPQDETPQRDHRIMWRARA